MELNNIDDVLRATFDDHHLTRSEACALGQVLDDLGDEEDTLRFIRNRAFELVRSELKTTDATDALNWLEGVIRLLDRQRKRARPVQIAGFFSPGDECVDCVVQQIRACIHAVDICVYTITDNRIKRTIRQAFDRGVRVRIITDDEKIYDVGSDVFDLRDHGIEVAIDGSEERMHHKFALFDQKRLATGSYNWTRSAAYLNYENVVLTDDRKLVNAFTEEFERLWCALPRLT